MEVHKLSGGLRSVLYSYAMHLLPPDSADHGSETGVQNVDKINLLSDEVSGFVLLSSMLSPVSSFCAREMDCESAGVSDFVSKIVASTRSWVAPSLRSRIGCRHQIARAHCNLQAILLRSPPLSRSWFCYSPSTLCG